VADIGKIAVSFTASAGGLIEGAGKASDALHKFAVDAATASASLDGKYASDFSIRIDELTAKLAAGDVTASAFGATLDSAFSRAASAIDSGLSASLGVLSKELDVGLLSAKGYTDGMTDLSQRASTAIDSALSDSIKASVEAMESGGTTMKEFTDSISMMAGTAAGAGVEQLTSGITSLTHALAAGVIDSETFLASQRDLAQTGAVDAIERTREALAALQGPLEDGRLSTEDFTAAATAINTSFRVEVMTEYETNIVALTAALDNGTITTAQFKDQHDTLNAALRTSVIGDLEEMLKNLPDAYTAAGKSAEELVAAQEAVRKEIEQTNKALDAAEKRASKPPAPVPSGGGGHGSGIVGGLEKFGGTASLIPGELGHVGHMMEQVARSAEMFSKGITTAFPSMAGMSAGLGLMAGGAVVVGGAIMSLVAGFAKGAREAQAMADQFGMTLKETAALKNTFDMVGVSVQQFALASKTIDKTLSSASNGAARASSAYAQIGVSVEELRAQSPEDQFKSVVIALAGVEDAGQRSALAIQLLGRQGAQMAGKFGKDAEVIKRRFAEAEEEVERFKTAYTQINSDQLIDAGGRIAGIAQAGEGLGKVIAEAFAPLAGGLGSAIADVLGSITNLLLLISPIINLIGAAIGGPLLLLGSMVNTVFRVVGAVAKVLYTFLPLESMATEVMKACAGIADEIAGIARWCEKVADSMSAWFSGGKTREELKAHQASLREIALLTEAAVGLEEKYGDKTAEVTAKIKEVNEAYKAGLIDKDVRVAALKDLNKQLAEASPRLKVLADAKKAMNDALGAASETASVGNTGGTAQAKRALEEYRKARKEMYADFKNKKISEDAYTAGINGLAAKFDDEMRRVKKVKVELDYGRSNYNKSIEKTGADKALDDFKRYEGARLAGGTFTTKEERGARETSLNNMIGGMGLNAPKLDGIEQFKTQMAELNRMYSEQTTVLKLTAEEERQLAGARKESIRQMIAGLPDAKKANSETEQFGENMRKLDEAQRALDDSTMTKTERADAQKDIDGRRGRLRAEYKGGPESPTAAFDKIMADIEAEKAKVAAQLAQAPVLTTPKERAEAQATQQTLNDKEKQAKEDFKAQNQDLLDSVMKGGQANKSANSAIDATSSEGAATYLRILRGGESLTGKQLTELRNSRLILAKIEQKVGPIKAANL